MGGAAKCMPVEVNIVIIWELFVDGASGEQKSPNIS